MTVQVEVGHLMTVQVVKTNLLQHLSP